MSVVYAGEADQVPVLYGFESWTSGDNKALLGFKMVLMDRSAYDTAYDAAVGERTTAEEAKVTAEGLVQDAVQAYTDEVPLAIARA